MFDIGWPEMLVVAVVLIVIVGPKDLPGMLRNFGRTTTKLRSMAADFRKQFDDALKEAELDDVKGIVDDVRKLNPASDIKKALNPIQKAAEDVRSGLDAAMRPQPEPQSPTSELNGGGAAKKPADEAKPEAAAALKTAAKTNSSSATEKATPAKKPAAARKAATKPAAKSTAKSSAKPKSPAKSPAKKAESSKKAAGSTKGGSAA
ncbi:MAG: twin-arginine translocase subunit TatB [Rhizobiaceae bacterium]|nr:twin-arginine translocase subunit TatB [Rhizobiaceae bacterium]